jgi:hypothetical protein
MDVGAEVREERQLYQRRGAASAIDVVGHEGDLTTELLGRLRNGKMRVS